MYQEQHIDKSIGQRLIALDAKERSLHTPSGKLSASQLGMPLQWQVLKSLGVGSRVIDEYVLRKFFRGKQIETWMISEMPNVLGTQKKVEYRNVVGIIDAVVDTSTGYQFNFGTIPHEVKSVSNAKFKRIEKRKSADMPHVYQAGLYALAEGSKFFAIDYVASDDLRVLTFVMAMDARLQGEIDHLIDQYDDCIKKEVVPIFVEKETWQAHPTYQQFPEWQYLKDKEIKIAMDHYYPDAWKKLKARL